MQGYLWKRRFYTDGVKKGVLRLRFVIYDDVREVLKFKTKAEEPYVHKQIPLDEISEVVEYGDNGFILVMRQVATHEACGAAFLFEVGVECVESFNGLSQGSVRDLWVNLLKGKVNSINSGLDLVLTSMESIHQRYEVLLKSPRSLLGTGMSGDVRLIFRKSDKMGFAMKSISLSGISSGRLGALRREIDIMKSLDHPHIARLQETFLEPKLYCRLVIELCEGGELFKRLHSRKYFSERYAKKLITTMLKALNYLHTNLIVHRDLKLENWLFRNKSNFLPCEGNRKLSENEKISANRTVKKANSNCDCRVCEDCDIALIDFGLSRRFRSPDEVMLKQVGTCYYVAPEVLSGSYQGCHCDMWSLGVISFILLSGKAPFDGENDEIITNKVRVGVYADISAPSDDPSFVWRSVSDTCKDFVKSLLKMDPLERMTAEQALKHPWISTITDPEEPSHHVIDDSVLERLRRFSKFKELKRLAMEVIAFSLEHNEIKDLKDLFERIDYDNDGFITLEDIVIALKDYDSIDEMEIRAIFEALDEEKSGKVHVNEFVAGALQAKYAMDEQLLQEAFFRLDSGQKGKVTLEDITRVLGGCASADRIQKIWQQACEGANNSTDITFENFMELMRSDGEDKIVAFKRQTDSFAKRKDSPPLCDDDSNELSKRQMTEKKKVAVSTARGFGSVSFLGKGSSIRGMSSFFPVGRVRQIFARSHKPAEVNEIVEVEADVERENLDDQSEVSESDSPAENSVSLPQPNPPLPFSAAAISTEI